MNFTKGIQSVSQGSMKDLVMSNAGMMRRMTAKVSPGIQGTMSLSLLSIRQRVMLEDALDDACRVYQCTRRDLEWSMDPKTSMIRIRKRKVIEL